MIAQRRTSWARTVAVILLPVVANTVLAAVLISSIVGPNPGTPRASGDLTGLVPAGPIGRPIPGSDFSTVQSRLQALTGHDYDCAGPYPGAAGTVLWACRVRDAIVIVEGLTDGAVVSVDATWFGFVADRTDLPAWAQATAPFAGAAIGGWVLSHLGQGSQTTVDGVVFKVGGSRGAMELTVANP